MFSPFLLLSLLCVISYGTGLSQQFMLDDYVVLFNEAGVANKSFLQLFTSHQHIFYRPVGHIFLWLMHQGLGANVAAYHLANLALFSAICFLFFKITERLTQNRRLAYLTAALYAIHPINSMLVNYVTANVISTFVLTMQLSFLFVIKAVDAKRPSAYVGSLLFFVLSLFSHEMSMIFPAHVFCLLYFLRGYDFKKALLYSLPFAILATAYFLFRWQFFSLKGMVQAAHAVMPIFNVYISSVMKLIYWYAGKLLWPQDIIFLWTVEIEKNFSPFEVFRFFAIAAILVFLMFFRLKKGPAAFALSIFAVGFIPVFWASYAHFPFAEPLIEPHWFYFSSLGFFILLALAFERLWLNPGSRKWTPLVLAAVVFGYSALLWQNNQNWKDQETYCRFWLKHNEANTTPYYGLGQVLLSRGDARGAIDYLEQGLKKSRYHSAFMTADLGYAYFLKGDYFRAQGYFERAFLTDPGYSVTLYYFAILAAKQNQPERARALLQKAIQLYPRSPLFRQELSLLLRGQPLREIYPLTYFP